MIESKEELEYDIKIYHNIFSDEDRKKILNKFKPLLCKIENCPGLQTYPELHKLCWKTFDPFGKIKKTINIDREIQRSWVNFTDINLAYESWHTHNYFNTYKYTCCYMIENPEGIGTWFNINGKIYNPKVPTNSIIVFPNNLLHTVPPNVKEPRYSLAIDFY